MFMCPTTPCCWPDAAGLPGADSKVEEPLYSVDAVAGVMDAVPTAHSLAMACLQSFTLLVGCHKELPRPLLEQVLRAIAQQQQPAGDDQVCFLY